MTRFVLATVAASTLASAASASFTGFSVERGTTAGGNTRYSVYANFSASNLVFLNAFSFVNVSGTMNARHQDFFVADGEVGTWQAGSSVSAADRGEDSWVTASGLATASGWGSALDPGFANGGTVGDVNAGAGWYDATPGTANAILAGGTQGGGRSPAPPPRSSATARSTWASSRPRARWPSSASLASLAAVAAEPSSGLISSMIIAGAEFLRAGGCFWGAFSRGPTGGPIRSH
jgi:hypothetical protein